MVDQAVAVARSVSSPLPFEGTAGGFDLELSAECERRSDENVGAAG